MCGRVWGAGSLMTGCSGENVELWFLSVVERRANAYQRFCLRVGDVYGGRGVKMMYLRSWMKMMVLSVGAVVLVLLGGCVTQEEIDRQFQSRRAASYERLTRAGQQANGAGVSEELEYVTGQLSVERCVELALTHNKDVQSALLKLDEAAGVMTEARATALPSASLGAANRFHDDIWAERRDSFEVQASVEQPLYLGGLAAAAIDAAAVYRHMSNQELRQARQAVLRSVRLGYLGVLLARELEKVALQSRVDADEHLADVRKKLRFGAGTRFDVLRAEVRLRAIEAELIRVHNDYELAVASLLNEMGVSAMSKVELSGELAYEATEPSGQECLAEALTRRPDLLIGEAMIRLAEDNVKSEQTGDRPKVYLQGVYVGTRPEVGGSDDGDGRQWDRTMNAGIVAEWPIFDGFRTAGRVTQAKVEVDRQQVAVRKLERQIQLDVTQGLLNVHSGEEFVESQLGNVANAEEALRLAQVNFREGNGTSLDVITAESGLAQARSDYSTAVHNYEAALLELHWAAGTLGEAELPSGSDSEEIPSESEADQPVIDRELLPGVAAEDANEETAQ